MSWSRKILAACGLACLLSLAACGFEPMYGNHGVARAVDNTLPDIAIESIPTRDGQYLRNILMDRLYLRGRPYDAPYTLRFTPLNKTITDIGIQKNGTSTRAQIDISTEMQLLDSATGKVIMTRDLKTVGAYNLQNDQLATLLSEQNITESILQEMSDEAVTDLGLYFRRLALRYAAAKKPAGKTKPQNTAP